MPEVYGLIGAFEADPEHAALLDAMRRIPRTKPLMHVWDELGRDEQRRVDMEQDRLACAKERRRDG